MPAAGDVVLVRRGHRVVYDSAADAVIRSVHIGGTLTFSTDRDTLLCAGLIRIAPEDECREEGFDCHAPAPEKSGGTEAALEVGIASEPVPAKHRAVIRLTYIAGMDKQSFPALVACGGRMDLHGAPLSHSWVKLKSSAARDSTEVELAETVAGWKAGDQVLFPTTEMSEFYQQRDGRRVIPSVLDDTETETGEIAAVGREGLLLKAPLKFKHQAIGEFRGEVANLSRNVVIETADPGGPRGHTMYHRNSSGSISWTEFRHLGKRGVLGRYPVHFHLCGDTMRGSSVTGASIWDSGNRWLTVHGTDYLLVQDCVGYRCTGHGFFLEDGTEVNNIFDRNLAVQSLMGKPLPQQDLAFDPNDAAGFWWANCLNCFTRNVAAECEKFGFRFQMTKTAAFSPELPVRQADGTLKKVDVRTLPFIRFEGNEAHSQRRFGLNLGGFHGQSETADLDRDGNVIDRTSYLGGDVQGVGPDAKHPFLIRDFLVWRSQWGLHSAAPNVQVRGFTAHDVNYVVWRSNVAGHDYSDLHFSDIHVSTIFNGWGIAPTRKEQLRYVDPVDDAPPVTLITDCRRDSADIVRVSGVAVDDGGIREVLVNGRPAVLQPGPVHAWTQLLSVSGGRLEITAGSVDETGNREQTPHRIVMTRDGQTVAPSAPQTDTAVVRETGVPKMYPRPAPAATPAIREAVIDPASLPWPLWDGKETVVAWAQRAKLDPVRIIDLSGEKLEMVLIPAASFLMGSAPDETDAQSDERPQHRVCLTTPFYLGKYELTQAQYRKVTGTNPSCFPGDDHPVEQVSWNEANAFLKKAGHGLRLPSEAEWECACRAGTATAFSSGHNLKDLSAAGWWGHNAEDGYGNAPDGTSAEGKKSPNAFGLYDMHGNVYEWCSDNYQPSYYATSPVMNPPGGTDGDEKVIRGGSWEGAARHCRSANRNGFHPDSRGYLLGFRVAISVPPH